MRDQVFKLGGLRERKEAKKGIITGIPLNNLTFTKNH